MNRRPILVLCVETTGERLPTASSSDALISVGWCCGTEKEMIDPPSRIDVNLKKPGEMTWEVFWGTKTWTPIERYWGRNLHTLEELQKSTLSLYASMSAFNRMLIRLEKNYSDLVLVAEEPSKVYTWLNILLSKYGHEPLHLTREGERRLCLGLDLGNDLREKVGHTKGASSVSKDPKKRAEEILAIVLATLPSGPAV